MSEESESNIEGMNTLYLEKVHHNHSDLSVFHFWECMVGGAKLTEQGAKKYVDALGTNGNIRFDLSGCSCGAIQQFAPYVRSSSSLKGPTVCVDSNSDILALANGWTSYSQSKTAELYQTVMRFTVLPRKIPNRKSSSQI